MINKEEIIEAIGISLVVATFLLNTGRALTAIELCKESLVLLNRKALMREKQFGKLICTDIFKTLFQAYCRIHDNTNAITYGRKLLVIHRQCDERVQEGWLSIALARMYQSENKYVEAKELYKRAVTVMKGIGNKNGEAIACEELGTVFESLGDYDKAKEYLEKALAINMEIGDREGEATCCGNLGNVFESLGYYVKAKEYHEKTLTINMEIGDRAGEATCYANLGIVFTSLGYYVKAKEYHEKALTINMEIGDRAGEATCYGNLAIIFQTLGDYVKAEEYLKKGLTITTEIGNRAREGAYYRNLGGVYLALRQYRKSKNYSEKALAISLEIFDRDAEATTYANLGCMFQFLGDNVKAKEYYEKALAIKIEIGNRNGQAETYQRLGSVFQLLGEYVMVEEYIEKALSISKDIRVGKTEILCYCNLALVKVLQQKDDEAFSYLFRSIEKCEELRSFNADNDQIKISFADKHFFPYQMLSALFCESGDRDSNIALYAAELGRARALADLMATQYSAETHISANPQSWIGIENVMTKENNCTCLYISYYNQKVFLWILKTNGVISFQKVTVDENALHKRLAQPAENLDEFFAIMAKSFRSFSILPEEVCEDRSLNDIDPAESDSSQEESLAAFRNAKNENDPELSLTLFHEMLINSVLDLLKEPEIIIVPDRNLYSVPFAALLDKSGKYLSETFRIRIIPSLTTLKLIQDSPGDYHSQTGALIVGDPDVGDVIYNGRRLKPLPGAREEAEMIGRLLGAQPLLGKEATKQAVLQRIASVSLIHFAAHGNAERGEIALAPPSSTTGIPQEDDYLLKMSDISQVQLQAKLVVLSCCHSGKGQIRAEGVVGIARAFLGSGARSVLAALWALEDRATKQSMSCFYEHLVRGESASESLHKAMRWMRGNDFTKVSEWAPFMLIGDDVTFNFGK
ncbi:hypothetical protein ACROYT_G001118 [Oculina patagonica]